MNLKKIISEIQQDQELRSEDKILVCLNDEYTSMLEGAFLLDADRNLQKICWEANSGGEQADEAVIRLSEDGDDLVSFHETRPNSKRHRPNGILVCEREFPCVVFANTGRERLTVGMKGVKNSSVWVVPGDYTVFQDADINDPEVQKALQELSSSPAVLAEVEELRREAKEKEGQV